MHGSNTLSAVFRHRHSYTAKSTESSVKPRKCCTDPSSRKRESKHKRVKDDRVSLSFLFIIMWVIVLIRGQCYRSPRSVTLVILGQYYTSLLSVFVILVSVAHHSWSGTRHSCRCYVMHVSVTSLLSVLHIILVSVTSLFFF